MDGGVAAMQMQMELEDIVKQQLFELFVFISSLPQNRKTKVPTVKLTQEQAVLILKQIQIIVGNYGSTFKVEHTPEGVEISLGDIEGDINAE